MSTTEGGGLPCCHGYPCGCMCLLLFFSILLSNYGFLYWALKSSKILRIEPKVMATSTLLSQGGIQAMTPLVTMVREILKCAPGSVSLLSLISQQAPKNSFETIAAWCQCNCLSQKNLFFVCLVGFFCFFVVFNQGQKMNERNLSLGNHYTFIHGTVQSLETILSNKHWLLDVAAETFNKTAVSETLWVTLWLWK